LTNNALQGTLPDEIYQLSSLEELLLNYNNFTGSLSTRIGQLQNLQLLYMYQNELSGEIPSHIGQLERLKELALGDNHFTGTLPNELMKLSNLSILALERYEKVPNLGFHGPLPDFATLSNLRELQLGGNHFTVGINILCRYDIRNLDYDLPSIFYILCTQIKREQYPTHFLQDLVSKVRTVMHSSSA
jgi:Leucine-rich repeat (LRR) protein